jgi:hypothetical protein
MVHALNETGRVLSPGGNLIDLRPLAIDAPLELLFPSRIESAGMVDMSLDLEDDAAANEAVDAVERQGIFHREYSENFEFAYYWDSLQGAKIHIEEEWKDSARLPRSVEAQATRLIRAQTASYRIRIRLAMQMIVLEKVTE